MVSGETETKEMSERRYLPFGVVFYVPNLLGYARIILSFLGLFFSSLHHSRRAVITWIIAAILDILDGIIARWLNQTSSYGVIVDIAADNILRSCIWISCVGVADDDKRSNSTSTMEVAAIVMFSTLILCLEWCTMVSTQVLQVRSVQTNKSHWKKGDDDPPIVQMFFRNNFHNPMGALGIYGLYASPISLYISLTCSPAHFIHKIIVVLLGYVSILPQFEEEEQQQHYCYYISVTIWTIFQVTAHLGRCICIPIESYFIVKYMSTLATEDEQNAIAKNKAKLSLDKID